MNIKKISLALIVLSILILSVSSISAFEWSFNSDDSGNNINFDNGELTIQDLTFHIPDGFTQDDNETKLAEETDFDGNDAELTQVKFVDGDKEIYVKVLTLDDGSFTSPSAVSENSVNKTISEQEGLLDYFDDGTPMFYYVEDGCLIEIDAPDESTLADMLK